MATLPVRCPSCETALEVERLKCPGCATRLEGQFELPALLRLTADDLEFIVAFVRASGSLKEMARLRRQSYPTIRNRLDEVIANLDTALDAAARTEPEQQRAILDAVANGTMTVAEAGRKLGEAKV
jgi:hypothetical protein